MYEALTDLERLLLDRWADTVGLWDAITELEDKLGRRLEAVATRLKPWLELRGYQLFDVEPKYASIYVVKKAWLKKKDEPLIYITVSALYPFGYRKVEEEHPYVWLMADRLSDDEQTRLESTLSARLGDSPDGWINEDCDLDSPCGKYVSSHGDKERIVLAQSEETLEEFIKTQLEPMLAIGEHFDAALLAAKPGLKSLAAT